MGAGRPTKYRPEYAKQAGKLCLLGYTNDDMAEFFGVAPSTIDKWIAEKPEFSGSIKENRESADFDVVNTLYNKATGFEHEGQYYPPDSTAIIFWLKNRQPKRWRDKKEVDNSHKIQQSSVSFADVEDEIADQAEK